MSVLVLATGATDGLAAIQALEEKNFDVVLMDVQMPVMDGLEATRNIRRLEKTVGKHPGIPIIAMTAGAMQTDRDRSLAVGMDDHLVKPINPRSLSHALSRWLPQRNTIAK